MPEHPLVSIVVPCFNSERFLHSAIDSVRAQSYPHWELIAVDDCSTDRTRELLYAAASAEPRIRVVLREQRGGRPAVTKNTGLTHCTGQFLCFLDHDDTYKPHKLAALVEQLVANPSCIAAFANAEYINADGAAHGRYLTRFLVDAETYLTPIGGGSYACSEDFWRFQVTRYAALLTITCMVATDRLPRGALRFDESYKVCDDTDQWIRLGRAGRMVYVDSIVAGYRLHEANVTQNKLAVALDTVRLQAMQAGRYLDLLDAEGAGLLRTHLAEAHADVGWVLRGQGRRLAASAAYARAALIRPTRRNLVDVIKAWLPVRGQ